MKVSVGDFELNCEVEGKEGAPWVTFSHALGNNMSLWDDQVALLKDDFHILRYDHRGHGGSDAPPGPYSFDDLMKDACALLDHFRIDKNPLGRALDWRHAGIRYGAKPRQPAAVTDRL